MNKVVTILSIFGSFIIYALTVDLFEQLFMFVLFGFIPGRAEPLTANQMLFIYGFATIVVTTYSLYVPIKRFLVYVDNRLSLKHSRTA
ncbi:MAG: hypothetical protein QG649_102 [Patescibacteria group bacterium]|nr:hypothetical protein [Patescibacteria group bacterium]